MFPSSRKRRRRKTAARSRRRVSFQSLEDRRLLAAFLVNTLGDSGSGNGSCAAGCTLRDAVLAANASAGPDTISFDSGVTGVLAISATRGSIEITDALEINGPGAETLEIRSNANDSNSARLFDIFETAGEVTIEGLTMTGGHIPFDMGGAIRTESDSPLTIRDSVISGNVADAGGAIFSQYEGEIRVENSTLQDNQASGFFGGAIYSENGSIQVTGSTLTRNTSYGAGGGIASLFGNITITDSTLSENQTLGDGYSGGGIYSDAGDVTIQTSSLVDNTATNEGGGVFNLSGPITITDSTISGNTAGGGGGVLNDGGELTITRTLIEDNVAQYSEGGGVSNIVGQAVISQSTIRLNRSVDDGGGVSNISGAMLIRSSLISENSSTIDGGGLATGSGPVAIVNSTVHDNTAGLDGGGLHSDTAALTVINSTITANTAPLTGGGIGFESDGVGESLTVVNSIIAENTAPDGDDFLAPTNPATSLDVRRSLIGNNRGSSLAAQFPDANSNFIGSNSSPLSPNLEPLADNGGSVLSRSPGSGSVAINNADVSLAIDPGPDAILATADDSPLLSDGRGGLFLRTDGVATDMGAIEVQSRPVLIVDTTSDVFDGDLSPGNRSLREMIFEANTQDGPDSIVVQLPTGSVISLAGDIDITEDVTLQGPGADLVTIDGNGLDRLFDVSGDDVTISGLRLTGGNAPLTEFGGLVRYFGSGELRFSNVLADNGSALTGGAVSAISGSLFVVNSTFTNSVASSIGGAIYASSGVDEVTLVNSTLTENTANRGAAIHVGSVDLTIDSSTIVANTAVTSGGGLRHELNPTDDFELTNSILALNTAPSDPNLDPGPSGQIDIRSSLIGDVSGTSLTPTGLTADSDGNLFGSAADPIDPLLGPLGDNGGSVPTMLPSAGSPALESGDATRLPLDRFDIDGDNVTAEFLPIDATGRQRVNGLLDMGAVEAIATPVVTWEMPDPIVFGTALGVDQLNAMTDVPGTFTYTPNAGTELSAGDGQTLSVLFTPDDTDSFQPVTVTTTIDVTRADAVVVWDNPDPIILGTRLGDAQLDATSEIPGTFVYSPPSGTLLGIGANQVLSVTFTPADSLNFNPVMASVLIEVTAPIDLDYGDAPSGYPVLRIDDGARHETSTLFLGASVSSESDGSPSPTASSDDGDDGITFLSSIVGSDDSLTVASLIVEASESGQIDAWIDFNRDGDWDDEGERILDGPIDAGENRLNFEVPQGASVGDTAARFRISNDADLGPTGSTIGGEVEDYWVTIQDGATSVASVALSPTDDIEFVNDRLLVDPIDINSNDPPLFGAPLSSLSELSFTPMDPSVAMDFRVLGRDAFTGTMAFTGTDQFDQLIMESAAVDLTDGSIALTSIERVDLRGATPTTITLDGISSPGSGDAALQIQMGDGDELVYADVAQWSLATPEVIDGEFFTRLVHEDGNEVLLSTVNEWTNPIDRSDIDGSGSPTPGDALTIINVIRSGRYIEGLDRSLVSAGSLDDFPGLYLDQNSDGRLSPFDALSVINDIRRRRNSGGSSGESASASVVPAISAIDEPFREFGSFGETSADPLSAVVNDESAPRLGAFDLPESEPAQRLATAVKQAEASAADSQEERHDAALASWDSIASGI